METSTETTVVSRDAAVWDVLQAVPDPEIPVLSVVDLGIVRYVHQRNDGVLCVGISPTYSGCPATAVIKQSVKEALHSAGFAKVQVDDVLAPAWTSDWISTQGREKLREYGIAPPAQTVSSLRDVLHPELRIECPLCHSSATQKISEFGSTPCKALYRCTSCLEPFDYFKCH